MPAARERPGCSDLEIARAGLRPRPAGPRRADAAPRDARPRPRDDDLGAAQGVRRLAGARRASRAEYGDTPFGRGCLAARRLIEVGVRCVEVTLGRLGHPRQQPRDPQAKRQGARPGVRRAAARPVAAKPARADGRPLLRRVRPHAQGQPAAAAATTGRAASAWPLAGGGIRGGLVIGQTDPEGIKDPVRPTTIEDVHATVLTGPGPQPGQGEHGPGHRPADQAQRGQADPRAAGLSRTPASGPTPAQPNPFARIQVL